MAKHRKQNRDQKREEDRPEHEQAAASEDDSDVIELKLPKFLKGGKKKAAAKGKKEKIDNSGNSGNTDKTDDEIELDFSGIKKLFSRGKSSAEAKEEAEAAEEEKAEAEQEAREEAEEELEAIEFDVRKIGEFVINNRKLITLVVLLAIFSFSFYVRMVPAKYTLLSAYDPFFWYRYAKEFLDGGLHFPESDPFSYYPPGRLAFEATVGWPAMEAFFFLAMRRFIPGFTVMQAAKILPAVFGGATVFPAYLIGKKASSSYGGLFAAFFVGTCPAILTRTVAGFSDTDASVMLFSLAVVAIYTVMLTSLKNYRFTYKALLMSVFGGLIYAAFALTWSPANYLSYILLAFPPTLFVFYSVFSKGKVAKRLMASFDKVKVILLLTVLMLFIGAFASSAIIHDSVSMGVGSGIGVFTSVAKNVANSAAITSMKQDTTTTGSTGASNVFISVAEMQAPGWESYTSALLSSIYYALFFFSFGGAFLVFRYLKTEKSEMLGYATSMAFILLAIVLFFTHILISLLLAKVVAGVGVIIFLVTLMKRTDVLQSVSEVFFEDEHHTNLMLLILLWAGAIFTISTMGIRFIMILAPPVAIASGVFLDKVIHSTEKVYPKAAPVVAGILVLLVISQFAPSALAISNVGPSMNNEWHDTLTWIKENTPEATTTISWWDPGHWVTAITQRHSGADGAHYAAGPRPIGYRLEDFGYMFTTTSEEESLERMELYRGDAEELYVISSSDLLGKFVWLSYFSTGQKQNYIMAGKSGTQQQGNALLHVYQVAENIMVVLSEENGMITPWLYQGNVRQPISEMAIYQNNQLQKLNFGEGVDALVWVQPDYGMVIFMPAPVKDNILTKTYLFNGVELDHMELMYQNPQIKLFRINPKE